MVELVGFHDHWRCAECHADDGDTDASEGWGHMDWHAHMDGHGERNQRQRSAELCGNSKQCACAGERCLRHCEHEAIHKRAADLRVVFNRLANCRDRYRPVELDM